MSLKSISTCIALSTSLLLLSCASNEQLRVDEGQIFLLADGDEGPVDAAILKVLDARAQVVVARQTTPVQVILGANDFSPNPAEAIKIEIARLMRLGQINSKLAARLAANEVKLQQFTITISGDDLRNVNHSASTPPGSAAVDSVVRATAQSLVGASEVAVSFSVSVGSHVIETRGQGRYTARPGINTTVLPFRRAVAGMLHQIERLL